MPLAPPPGFAFENLGPSRLVIDAARRDRLVAEGIGRPNLLIAGALPREGGRGGVYNITLGGEDLVMRVYRRGGLARLLWKDRTLDDARSQREVAALAAALARGVPAVVAVAGVATAAGLGLYRHCLFTLRIPGATELLTVLNDPHRSRRARIDILYAAAQTVRASFEAGIEPADLHPRNLLILETPKLECKLVDLDGAVVQNGRLPPAVRIAALARFVRFLDRHANDGGRGMSRTDVARFIKFVEADDWKRTHRAVQVRVARMRWFHRVGSLWRPKSAGAASLIFGSNAAPRGPESQRDPTMTFLFEAPTAGRARSAVDRILHITETAGIGNFEILAVARDPQALAELRALSLTIPSLRFLGDAYKTDGDAWRVALRGARGNRIVVVVPRAFDARFLTEALDRIANEADVVVGARGSGTRDRRSAFERAGDLVRNWFLRIFRGAPTRDSLATIVARRDDRFQAAVRAVKSRYFATAELLTLLAEAGARIREAPVEAERR